MLLEISIGAGVEETGVSVVPPVDATGVATGAGVNVPPCFAFFGWPVGTSLIELLLPVELEDEFDEETAGPAVGNVRGSIHPAAESCEIADSISNARDRRRKVCAPWLASAWPRRSSESLY